MKKESQTPAPSTGYTGESTESLRYRTSRDTWTIAMELGQVEPLGWWNAIVKLEEMESGRLAQ